MASRRSTVTLASQCLRQPPIQRSYQGGLLCTFSTSTHSSFPLALTPRSFSTVPSRSISSTPARRKSAESQQPAQVAAVAESSKTYSFEDVQSFISKPDPNRIIIDVREPRELQSTGTIPTSINIPITSSPDALFLPASEFEDRFSFPKPDTDKEVVFFCKSGVRSRSAAGLARQAGYTNAAEYPGSWSEWSGKGGKVERGQ